MVMAPAQDQRPGCKYDREEGEAPFDLRDKQNTQSQGSEGGWKHGAGNAVYSAKAAGHGTEVIHSPIYL